MLKYANEDLVKELLPAIDNLERAITAMENNKESCEDLLKGVELTQNELTKVFEEIKIGSVDCDIKYVLPGSYWEEDDEEDTIIKQSIKAGEVVNQNSYVKLIISYLIKIFSAFQYFYKCISILMIIEVED